MQLIPGLIYNILTLIDNLKKICGYFSTKLIFKYCPWIWFGIGDERRQKFAQKIHNDNRYIEACRFAVYYYNINDIAMTKENLCEMHLDTENGQGDALSQVLIISKMIWEKKNICGW